MAIQLNDKFGGDWTPEIVFYRKENDSNPNARKGPRSIQMQHQISLALEK